MPEITKCQINTFERVHNHKYNLTYWANFSGNREIHIMTLSNYSIKFVSLNTDRAKEWIDGSY